MKLKWWHKALAKDLVLAKQPEDKLCAKYAKFSCKKTTIRRLQKDVDFIEYCEKIDAEVRDEVIKAKMRINMLASGLALDVIEEILASRPWDPSTGEGDKDYNVKVKADMAKDVVKMSDLGRNADEVKADVVINLITEGNSEEKENDAEDGEPEGEPKTAHIHRDE